MTRPTEHITNESGRYRRISTRMWGDEKFCRLSRPKPNGQSLFIYLLTGPQVGIIPGLYSIGERALSEQLGWPLKAFRKAWRELETLGIVRADWQKRVVWLEKSVRYNAPTSPNVVKSWRVALAEIPECPLKTVASTQLAAFCEALGPSFSEAFRGIDAAPAPKPSGKPSAMPSPKPSLNQDQEQDQEQEQQLGKREGFLKEDRAVLLERFDRFWARYPRQEQREPARMIWLEMGPSEPVTLEILVSLEAHRRSASWAEKIAKQDYQFIPYAKTWLRERRWLEMPPAASGPLGASHCSHTPRCADDVACTARAMEERNAEWRGAIA